MPSPPKLSTLHATHTTAALAPPGDRDSSFHRQGYLRHWLVAGPHEIPYEGPGADENILRLTALDSARVEPPPAAQLRAPGPFAQQWHYHYPGANCFVEHSTFFFRRTLIDSYAFAEIVASEDSPRPARLWVAGAADLWLNGEHIARVEITRYMQPDFRPISLPVCRGVNTVCVRLQAFGVRDTRILFGLQFPDTTGLAGRLPGAHAIIESAHWLDSVRTADRDHLIASHPAPTGVTVLHHGTPTIIWPAGASRLSLAPFHPFQITVRVATDDQSIARPLENSANRDRPQPSLPPDRRLAHLRYTATSTNAATTALHGRHHHLPLLARRLLGDTAPTDPQAFAAVLATIDQREDCADFSLATFLRMQSLGLATPSESSEIRRAALAFRYGMDEPGADGMCFWSENHSLLFHGCQLIAGLLYPDAVFSNSQRTGSAQAALGATRCRQWLERIERRGLEEFNSSTYIPVTLAALLNVIDFSRNPDLVCRGSALADQIYEHLAAHAFRGIVISPQGRVYRNVLYPEESGTQALLSGATTEVPALFPDCSAGPPAWTGGYVIYPASSPAYRPPARLATLVNQPVTQVYRQADVEIVLHKNRDYILTSLAIPASFANAGAKPAGLQPGGAGYQQHLWQASLAPGCHVFVNHPGASLDEEKSRPGYWYGNGVMPRLRQRNGVLQAIYNIPDGSVMPTYRPPHKWDWDAFAGGSCNPYETHPIPFTHAHWPTDVFDQHDARGHWVFGRKGHGYIALWCSQPLEPYNDVLTGRELRAYAHRAAWIVICSGLTDHRNFDSFLDSCLARTPDFSAGTLTLQMKDESPLRWSDH